MYQIVEMMDTALTHYTSYSLSVQWMALSTHHANKMSAPRPGLKCDNFGDPHFMNQCPKHFDDECIARNRKASDAPPRNRHVGGNGVNCGRVYGGGDGRGCSCGCGHGCGSNY